eukprot:TRINITY_DN84524_c0_g1_i1.p1 TRINITY_DN84524_c0_g1~~TRINITY_DN84524_c0_g1_i1.p1  ORF type:complete len:337 (-),score=95.58 TRINITY_DN84524_c0_g1_i1:101-1111(-)
MASADVAMTAEMVSLSRLGKTISCDSLAYLHLECKGQSVTSVDEITEFEHLQELDLANNIISDVAPIAQLVYPLRITLANNQIECISSWGPGSFLHLLHLNLSGNKLATLPSLPFPGLLSANLSRNLIASCVGFGGHAKLRSLDLSENKLELLDGLCDMPALETLNLSKNFTPMEPAEPAEGEEEAPPPPESKQSLAPLKGLPALKTLDISKNSYKNLEAVWEEIPALETLIATENAIATPKDMKPIIRLHNLRVLEVAENKVAEEGNIRIEALICNAKLKVVNGEEVTPEERDEAKETNETRIKEERERIAAEAAAAEEARLAAEAEAAAGAEEE